MGQAVETVGEDNYCLDQTGDFFTVKMQNQSEANLPASVPIDHAAASASEFDSPQSAVFVRPDSASRKLACSDSLANMFDHLHGQWTEQQAESQNAPRMEVAKIKRVTQIVKAKPAAAPPAPL
jgi:hypothetical protein